MKILLYQIKGLNENYYIDYLGNGLERNGHEVIRGAIKNDISSISQLKSLNLDLIIFGGFAFMNFLRHQGNTPDKFFLLNETKTKFIVMWYDNPERYLADLQFIIRSNYMFICCDSILKEEMIKLGFRNTHYLPCCVDTKIHYHDFDIKYLHSIAFAGSVFNDDTNIIRRSKSLDKKFHFILDEMLEKSKEGQYLHYFDVISKYINPFDSMFQMVAFNAIMEQKHRLRMSLFNSLENEEINIYGVGNFNPTSEANHLKNKKLVANGYLNQHTELRKLYSTANINLTIELLPASVHQRIFECSASNGFILCEDKKDMDQCFDRYEKWSTIEELKDKVEFIKKNTLYRKQVSDSMYKDVLNRHTCEIRTKQIIDLFNFSFGG